MADQSLAERLEMTHLQQPDSALAEAVEDVPEEVQKTEEVPVKEEEPIHFKYTASTGITYEAHFVNRALRIEDRMKRAQLEAQFNGGMPYEAIGDLQRAVNHAIAHMALSLKERTSIQPNNTWANNLRQLHDHNIVLALFGEVAAHENKFLGRPLNPAEG